ncbi:MAG: SIS domain-containing protein [Terriglobales bacterium]|jgi:D-sedoheptulose 7-phosphate isomerase
MEYQSAGSYFTGMARALADLSRSRVESIADALFGAYNDSRTTFLFGNGGSASLATHFACDLGKGTSDLNSDRRRFRVLSLTDNVPVLTALANDCGYESIFAEQLKNLAQPGDLAFAISCSGNSPNILKALTVARDIGVSTIGLGGFQGGRMKALCDLCLIVPSDNMQIIEDLHLSVAHCLFTLLRGRIEALDAHKMAAVGAQ